MFKKFLWLIPIMHLKYLEVKAFYYSKIFLKCGNNFRLWGNCYIKNPHKIEVGHNVSVNDGAYLNGMGSIKIGNNVSISALAIIVSTGLDIDNFKIKQEHKSEKITIGNNVQVGAGSIILSGLTIGSNVIIGAGAVVTKDVEDNCIVTGNPASLLRRLS